MKRCLILVIDFWIIQGTFSQETDEENDFQYWKTRYLSGSDYGSEYNLNQIKPKTSFEDSASVRTLFSWGANRGNKEINDGNFTFFASDENVMPGDGNSSRNESNIWWPWSNYEEWALSRKRNGLVNRTIVPGSSKKNSGEIKKKKKRRKKKKLNKQKKTDNKVLAEIFNSKPQTSFFSFETKVDKIASSEKDSSSKNSISFFSKEDTQSRRQPSIQEPDVKKLQNGNWDNNEMDNEIHSQPKSVYNYYDSIPIMETKNSLIDRIKKHRNLDNLMKGYSSRNFTDDANECLINNGGCEGLCINTPGSFKCHCPDGFKLDTNKCIDVNECLLRNGHGPCQGKCTNEWGGYKCSCEDIPGTRLAKDGHTCEDIDECKEQTAGCSHECINTVGSAFCLCPPGYMLNMDWKTCNDINECELIQLQEIKCENGCVNTIGSYTCL